VSAPKTLKIGTRKTPSEGILFQGTSVGGPEAAVTFHAGLINYDDRGDAIPQLAERIPTLAAGDWKVEPDGRMEVVWKLRPNLFWHDGRPLTADDLVFALTVAKDDDLALQRSRWVSLAGEATAPDEWTFVMAWRQPYMLANSLSVSDLPPLPRHLSGNLHQQGDKQAFINNPYWTGEFVGVGPYRMTELDPGTHIEGQAFDQYFLGRPKIDRVIFRYMQDVNVMVANLLAGEIDLISVGSIKVQDVQTIKQAWDRTSAGTVIGSPHGIRRLWFQFRDPGAPWLRDVRVRRALVHGLDRQIIVDTLYHGQTQIADTLPQPDDPLYKMVVDRGLPRHPFDVRRAEQLMAEAGWTRVPGAEYRGPGGQPFSIEIRTVGGSPENEREILSIANLWSGTGFNGTSYLIPSGVANANELRAKAEGVFSVPLRNEPEAMSNYITSQISTESTRWRGNNHGGYSNPLYDRLYDEYITTLDTLRRQGLLADLLKMAAEEVIFVPVYYDASTAYVAFRTGIRGPGHVSANQLANLWNVQTWEMN
jgi:peptide/nickel transport system substrate-binding protein